ncbi:hypothetical protein BRD56_08930 [Thermoplasmatales archaeon SW_10_69_26]|nr:MAG: hypothetical protein BRD56_08930 [Thermoplasmatales archaeon SW_10_69_26]
MLLAVAMLAGPLTSVVPTGTAATTSGGSAPDWVGPWLDAFDEDDNLVDDEAEAIAQGHVDDGNPDKLVPVLLTYDHDPTKTDVDRLASSHGAVETYRFSFIPTINAQVPADEVGALGDLDGVVAVEHDYELNRTLDVSAPATQSRDAGALEGPYAGETAGTLGYQGEGSVVAVLDSGVDNTNPAFPSGKRVAGADVSTPQTIECVDNQDRSGHGTHVASTAVGNPAEAAGGTAPEAQLVEVEISGGIVSLGGSLRGFEFVHEWNQAIENGEPKCGASEDDKINVATLSFGSAGRGGPNAGSAESAITNLAEQGVAVTIAVGNCGPQPSSLCDFGDKENGISSPGNAAGALGVANADDRSTISRIDDRINPSSSRGPNSEGGGGDGAAGGATGADDLADRHRKPDITAPGTDIEAACAITECGAISTRTEKTGTSMSTPHVAGISALLLQAGAEVSDETGGENLMEPDGRGFDNNGDHVPGEHPVRDALIHAADYRTAGVPDDMIDKWEGPGADGLTWNNGFGYGEVSAFGALCWAWANVLQPNGATPSTTVTEVCGLATSLTADAGGPYTAATGQEIAFTGTASNGDSPYEFTWNLGDGTTETGASFTYAYDQSGVYDVTLTVTDDTGTTATATTTATVGSDVEAPSVSITTPSEGDRVSGETRIAGTAGSSGGSDTTPQTFAGLQTAKTAEAEQTTAELAWDEASGGEQPYTYLVYQGTPEIDYETAIQETTDLSTTVDGLTAGQETCFAVRTQDSTGATDTNTVEECVTPTDETRTIGFHYHNGTLADAPEPAPDDAYTVKGTMSPTPGNDPKNALVGGGLSGIAQQTFADEADVVEEHPAVFVSEPLPADITLAQGVETITDTDGNPWTVAQGASLTTCIADSGGGLFFADVYEISDGQSQLALSNPGNEYANATLLDNDPVDGACMQNRLAYQHSGADSYTFEQGNKIMVGLTPDFFAGSEATRLKWDGSDLYRSQLTLDARVDGDLTQTATTDDAGDASTSEADIRSLGTATDEETLDVTADLAGDVEDARLAPTAWHLAFEHAGQAHRYAVQLGANGPTVTDAVDADTSATVTADLADDAVTVTIPWTEIGASPGDPITNLHVTSYTASADGLTPDDRAPDADGAELTAPATIEGGDLGVAGGDLSTAEPHGEAPTVHSGSLDTLPLQIDSGPLAQELHLGDDDPDTVDEATANLHISTWSNTVFVKGLNAELNAVTDSGTVTLASTYTDDGPFPNQIPTEASIPLKLGKNYEKVLNGSEYDESTSNLTVPTDDDGDIVVDEGAELQLRFWVEYANVGPAYSVYYDSPTTPSHIELPVADASQGDGDDSGNADGFRVLAEDDPAELPDPYRSMDLENAFLANDGSSLTATVDVHGFDPALPHPGSSAAEWEFNFEHESRTLGLWILSDGAQNPSFSASAYCLGCGAQGAGWAEVEGGFEVEIQDDTLTATIPFDAWEGALGGDALEVGDRLTEPYLQSRMRVPGAPSPVSVLPTVDRAPGGGPEETVPPTSSSDTGRNYQLQDAQQADPPTVAAFAADPTTGNAPLPVTFTGEVSPGSDPIDTVQLDPGDGSAPLDVPLNNDGTFTVNHTYESELNADAELTVTDTGDRSATASTTIDVGPQQEGVYVRVADGPLQQAVDDSGDWSDWHLDHDFSSIADGTEVTISAEYYDGSQTSPPDEVTVLVTDSGPVEIDEPADGAFLDPETVAVNGTTSDRSGQDGSTDDGSTSTTQAGMWTLPFDDDADRDGVQDPLEEEMDSSSGPFDVKVLLDREATEDDQQALGDLADADRAKALWLIDAVTLEGVEAENVRDLLDHDGAIRVEWSPPAEKHLALNVPNTKARQSTTYGSECVWGASECLGFTGRDVGYANFDSGVRESHEAFEWQTFANETQNASDSKIIDRLAIFDHESNAAHATKSAGAAAGTGGPSATHVGAAPAAGVLNVQALSEPDPNTGTVATRTCEALEKTIDHPADIRVASLSYGSVVPISSADDTCINQAAEQGLVVVTSSGNFGTMGSPATAERAITVGNIDTLNSVSRIDDVPCHGAGGFAKGWISPCGASGSVAASDTTIDKPEVMAPGVCVAMPTSANDNAYNECSSGTSFSAPIVAGVVALMYEANPDLTPTEVKEILTQTAHVGDQEPTGQWAPVVGYGNVDAYLAVQEARDRYDPDDAFTADAGGPYETAPDVETTLSASASGGTPEYSYKWELGDDNTKTGAEIAHTWTQAGEYDVTLTVTDADDQQATDTTTVTVADDLTVAITEPDDGASVSDDLTVTGDAHVPSPDPSLSLDDPLWTDPEGDASLFGAGSFPLDRADMVAGYAWGDEGPSDDRFNLGIGVADLPEQPTNAEYLRYGVQFSYADQEFWLDSKINPVFSAENQDTNLTPEFRLLTRAEPAPGEAASQWSFEQYVDGYWAPEDDLVAFNVSKTAIQDSGGNSVQDGERLTDLLGIVSLGANGASGPADTGQAPAGTDVTVSPEASEGQVTVEIPELGTKTVDATADWSATFDTTQADDGDTSITARVTAGSTTDEDVVGVTVNNEADTPGPSVTIETPAQDETVDGTVTIAGTAEDPTSADSTSTTSEGGILVEPLTPTESKAPLSTQIRTHTEGTITEWRVDWGDGTSLTGFGTPPAVLDHVYEEPGTHELTLTATLLDGSTVADTVTVQAHGHAGGEPSPSQDTLFFHLRDEDGDSTIDSQWTSADEDDPESNAGGSTSISVAGDGTDTFPLLPAPSQELLVRPGGVGQAQLTFSAPADIEAEIQLDVLVDGQKRASGSTTANFIAQQPNTVTFDVLVDDDWDGTVPKGAAVDVVVTYRTQDDNSVDLRGEETDSWQLTLPFTDSIDDGSVGTVEPRTFHPDDVLATLQQRSGATDSCTGLQGPLTETEPTGESASHTAFGCTEEPLEMVFTTTLDSDLEIAAGETVSVRTGVSGFPCGDCALAPIDVSAQVGTASEPGAVGETGATVGPLTFQEYPWMVDLTFDSGAPTTLAAGSTLQLAITFDSSQELDAYFGPPHAVFGGGPDNPWSLTVPEVTEPTAPAQVTGLEATAGDEQVHLDWTPVDGAEDYRVYRDGSQVAEITETRYTDTDVINGQSYGYTVSAVADGVEGPTSDTVTATPEAETTDERVEVTVTRLADGETVFGPTDADGVQSWSTGWDSTQVGDGDYSASALYTTQDGDQVRDTVAFAVDNVADNEPPRIQSFAADPSRADVDQPVNFTVNLSQGTSPVTYEWEFGDGSTLTTTDNSTVTHAYTEPGRYDVNVTATNDAGQDTATTDVAAVGDRYVEFREETADESLGAEEDWRPATATGPNGSWATWTYDWDASSSKGDVGIEARYFDGLDMNGPTRNDVTVTTAPDAVLDASPTTTDMNTTVTLDGSASADPDGTVTTYRFTPGDDSGSVTTDAATIEHNYTEPGTYNATLTVRDDDGRWSTLDTVEIVAENLAPTAAVQAPDEIATFTPATFDATDSQDPDGAIQSYRWSMGDGTSLTGATVNHTYEAQGTYTVELTVEDSNGATDDATHTIEVLNQAPRAALDVSPERDLTYTERTLDAGNSTDVDGSIAEYVFDPGDGTDPIRTEDPTLTHTYEQQGTFAATVQVVDDDGATSTRATVDVTVENRAPEIAPIPDQTVEEMTTLRVPVDVSDRDNTEAELTVDASGLPEGATFDADARELTWRPTADQAGTYTVTFSANDTYVTVEESVQITVEDVPRAARTSEDLGYQTIDEALAAVPTDGTVWVEPGNYTGPFTVDTPGVTLCGSTDAADRCLSEPSVNLTAPQGTALTLAAEGTSLQGVRLNDTARGAHVTAPSTMIEHVELDELNEGVLVEDVDGQAAPTGSLMWASTCTLDTSVCLTFTDATNGLTYDARYNDWGVYTDLLVEQRFEENGNDVIYQPYKDG